MTGCPSIIDTLTILIPCSSYLKIFYLKRRGIITSYVLTLVHFLFQILPRIPTNCHIFECGNEGLNRVKLTTKTGRLALAVTLAGLITLIVKPGRSLALLELQG